MRGLGGLLASRLGRLAGTGFGLGRGHTWHQIEVGSFAHQGAESKKSITLNVTVLLAGSPRTQRDVAVYRRHNRQMITAQKSSA